MAGTGYAPSGRQPTGGIQDAIGALKAKLGGGRQPARGIPTGGMVAGPEGRLPVTDTPPPRLALGGAPSGMRVGGVAPAAPAPSQFDRDAAATGLWRGAARFGKAVTDPTEPGAPVPGALPGPIPDAPPVASFPPAGGMQALPQDAGLNQVTGGAPLGYAPSGVIPQVLQAQLAKQQQLKGGFGALLQGALRQNPLATA